MQNLTVSLVQTPLHWEDWEANLTMLTQNLDGLGTTDLIVLPETFTAGFSMNVSRVAQTMSGEAVSWMKQMAARHHAVVAGSMVIAEHNTHYNRFIWMRPDGTLDYYDKRHLFSMAGEDEHFTGGRERKVVELKGWRICLQVCYDLRFPVWSRNRNDYDALIYVANWPEARRSAWNTLLLARAHENQCYVVGVNRVGKDGNDISYSGDSVAVDSRGTVISNIKPYEEGIDTVTLSWQELADYRTKFPVGNDADNVQILD